MSIDEHLRSLVSRLISPCCSAQLSTDGNLTCLSCQRIFMTFDNIIDLIDYDDSSNKGHGTEWLKKMDFRNNEYNVKLENRLSHEVKALYHSLDELSPTTKRFNDYLAHFILSKFVNRHVLLEVAGGTGYFIRKMADQFDELVLTDLSHQQILVAAKQLKIKNLLLVRADYLKSFTQKKTFDSIVCIDSLLYYDDAELVGVISQLLESLTVGGACVLDFHSKRFYKKNPRIRTFHKSEIVNLLSEFIHHKDFSLSIDGFCPLFSKASALPPFFFNLLSRVTPEYFHVRYVVTIRRNS